MLSCICVVVRVCVRLGLFESVFGVIGIYTIELREMKDGKIRRKQ